MRREVKVVVAVVLVLTHASSWHLRISFLTTTTHDLVDVILDSWTCVKRHVHDVERRLALLLLQLRCLPQLCF